MTIVDTVPPTIEIFIVDNFKETAVACSSGIVVHATSPSGALVNWGALASDPCGISTLDCSPLIYTFPIGTTTVTCTASDDTGNIASCSFSVIVRAPDLLISKTVDRTTVKAGQSLTYTIQVQNVGSSAASGVVVSDTLPPQTTFVSASVSQGTFSAPAVGSAGTVTWTAGNLAAGGTATLRLQVKVIGRGKDLIVNTATVTSSTLDSNPNNNTATITTLRKMGP